MLRLRAALALILYGIASAALANILGERLLPSSWLPITRQTVEGLIALALYLSASPLVIPIARHLHRSERRARDPNADSDQNF